MDRRREVVYYYRILTAGYDECASSTKIDVILINIFNPAQLVSMDDSALNESICLRTDDGLVPLPSYDLNKVRGTLQAEANRSEAYQYSLFDTRFILDGGCPAIDSDSAKMFVKRLMSLLDTELKFGDCVPLLWVAKDGSHVEVTINTSDERVKSYRLVNEHDGDWATEFTTER